MVARLLGRLADGSASILLCYEDNYYRIRAGSLVSVFAAFTSHWRLDA